MKTHYNAAEVTEDMTVQQIMMRRTACGTRATVNATVYMSSNWAVVDCQRCLNKREAVERQQAHRAKMAALRPAQ